MIIMFGYIKAMPVDFNIDILDYNAGQQSNISSLYSRNFKSFPLISALLCLNSSGQIITVCFWLVH